MPLSREPRESSKKEQAKDVTKYFVDVKIVPREPGHYLNFVVALTELYVFAPGTFDAAPIAA
jgi:hypothetical protein